MAFIVFSFIFFSRGYLFLFADKKIKFPASRVLPLPCRRAAWPGWSSSRSGQGADWRCQRGKEAALAAHRNFGNFGDVLKSQQNPLVLGSSACSWKSMEIQRKGG